MMNWSSLRDMIWDARWDALVLIARSIWETSLDNPWMFGIWAIVLLTLTRRGWTRVITYAGKTFLHSHLH